MDPGLGQDGTLKISLWLFAAECVWGNTMTSANHNPVWDLPTGFFIGAFYQYRVYVVDR